MRAAALVSTLGLAIVAASSHSAIAEPLPSGTIGLVSGGVAGTGADNKRIGYGIYSFGMQASWQPMTTERTRGWTLRWSTMFGRLYNGTAAQIDPVLLTVQMDLMLGIRFRPWTSPRRYLTARGGGEVLRTNQPIPSSSGDMSTHRNFLGVVASVGFDQYLGSLAMVNVDVQFGLAGSAPSQAAVIVGIGFTGP